MDKIDKESINTLKQIIMVAHKTATGYEPDKNILSEGNLEYIVYEALKVLVRFDSRGLDSASEAAGAYLMHGIATRHVFIDGNKRTALMVFLIFRYFREYTTRKQNTIIEKIKMCLAVPWNNKDDTLVKFMVELADYKHDYDDVLKFVRETFK